MASEIVRKVAGRRFVADVPKLPGVIAYGETAAQAQMRAAVTALRVVVLRESGADPNGCVLGMGSAVRPSPKGAIWRSGGVGRYVAVRGVACLAAAWLNTAWGCALSEPYAMASLSAGCLP